jgi:hypothetical protein
MKLEEIIFSTMPGLAALILAEPPNEEKYRLVSEKSS